ncbi:hypothetical protein [Piscirickettsia litoralis]|nr:hypothetical protein [Piscirickettsia litoralis]
MQIDKTTWTVTPSPEAARAAFVELLTTDEYKGKKAQVVLSLNSYRLMLHRFNAEPGSEYYVGVDDEITLEMPENLDPKWLEKKNKQKQRQQHANI